MLKFCVGLSLVCFMLFVPACASNTAEPLPAPLAVVVEVPDPQSCLLETTPDCDVPAEVDPMVPATND